MPITMTKKEPSKPKQEGMCQQCTGWHPVRSLKIVQIRRGIEWEQPLLLCEDCIGNINGVFRYYKKGMKIG